MSEIYEKYFGEKPVAEAAKEITSLEDMQAYVNKMIQEKHSDDIMGAEFIASQLWKEVSGE